MFKQQLSTETMERPKRRTHAQRVADVLWVKLAKYLDPRPEYNSHGGYDRDCFEQLIADALREAGLAPLPRSVQEAINSGDGSYRP